MTTKTVLREIRRAMARKLQQKGRRLGNGLDGLDDVLGDDAASLDLLHGDWTGRRSRLYEVKTEIPVLRSHIVSRSLSAADFQQVNPDVPLECVITGRYASNLVPTEEYFLVFGSVDALKEYYQACAAGDCKLDGSRINPKSVKTHELAGHLRFMYPNFMPDLADLPRLVDIITTSPEVTSAKDRTIKSLQQLLQGRSGMLDKYYQLEQGKQTLLEWSERLEKAASHQKHQPGEPSVGTVERSCCVILRNVPANISPRKLTDFFWDLAWFADASRRVRPIFTDKTTNFTTYVLCFADTASARRCVRRADANHLFYNPVLPVVSAEPL